MAEADSGFVIDGRPYEIPRLEQLTLDEERILYTYSGTVLSDFAPLLPGATEEQELLWQAGQLRIARNPDFKRALVHIAYRREHPEATVDHIQATIGKLNATEITLALLQEDDALPPALSSQKPPDEPSETRTPLRSTGSGRPTETDSAPVVALHERTGTGG